MSAAGTIPSTPGIYIRKDDDWDKQAWTAAPNILIRDETMSWDARMAFVWLSSHNKTFALNAESLAAAGPKGRNHARQMLRELEERGWLTRHRHRNPASGRFDVYFYHLHTQPVPVEERTFLESTAKPRPFPKTPATDYAGAGADDFENLLLSPATDPPGAGQPGAGTPGAGQAGVSRARLSLTLKKTKKEDQEVHTPRERGVPADEPPCVPEPVVFDPLFADEPEPPADPIETYARPNAATKIAKKINRSTHTVPARALVDRYCAHNPLPRDTQARLWPVVTKLLAQPEVPEWAILEAIPLCLADCGPHLLGDFVSRVLVRSRAPEKLAGADRSIQQGERLRAQLRAEEAAAGSVPALFGARRAIGDGR